MTRPGETPSENFLRFSRRSQLVLLALVLGLGAVTMALTLWPAGVVSQWLGAAPWAIPAAVVVAGVLLRSSLRGRALAAGGAELKAIVDDEFRQLNLQRASRLSLIAVLVIQVPLAALVMQAQAARPALVMAEATITLGFATFLALFLFFDRD